VDDHVAAGHDDHAVDRGAQLVDPLPEQGPVRGELDGDAAAELVVEIHQAARDDVALVVDRDGFRTGKLWRLGEVRLPRSDGTGQRGNGSRGEEKGNEKSSPVTAARGEQGSPRAPDPSVRSHGPVFLVAVHALDNARFRS
jgi:hypothetical protein